MLLRIKAKYNILLQIKEINFVFNRNDELNIGAKNKIKKNKNFLTVFKILHLLLTHNLYNFLKLFLDYNLW